MKTIDTKTGVIYIKISPVDEDYDGMHADLIAQDIMPTYTSSVQWERVEAMHMDEVAKMLEEIKAAAARNARSCYTSRIAQMTPPPPIAFEIDTIAAKYGITQP